MKKTTFERTEEEFTSEEGKKSKVVSIQASKPLSPIDLYDAGAPYLKYPHPPEKIISNLKVSLVDKDDESIRVQLFDEPEIIIHQTQLGMRRTQKMTAEWKMLLRAITDGDTVKDEEKVDIQRKLVESLNRRLVAFINSVFGCRIPSNFKPIVPEHKRYKLTFKPVAFLRKNRRKEEICENLESLIRLYPDDPNEMKILGRIEHVYEEAMEAGIDVNLPVLSEAAQLMAKYSDMKRFSPEQKNGHYWKRKNPTSDDQWK